MNYKNNLVKNILVIITCITIFFTSVFLLSIDRKYLFIENAVKYMNLKVNDYFLHNIYLTNKVSSNVITSKIKELEKENNSLKKLMNIKENSISCINAKIYNHRIYSFYSKAEIDVGIKNNVNLKMPVINTEGLVGFISKIGNNVSEVNMIYNFNKDDSIIVAVDNEDKAQGILDGYDQKGNLLIVDKINSKSNVNIGDKVVLSDYMNNDNYKGLYIGEVYKINESDYGLTKKLYVKSGVNFNDVFFVCVVI